MIPKVIHYCWFGGNPLPEEYKNYIKSWKKYCPDYEIREWNESNFDINCCDYVKEAYEAKKWAFVSDYARFWILHNHGGLYFDTDVEVLRPLDEIIQKGPFMGVESFADNTIAPGLGLAANPGLGLYKEILTFYESIHFLDESGHENLTTVVKYTTDILMKHGLEWSNKIQCVGGIYIYPKDYFNPKDYDTGIITLTENSYTIHHFAMSWISEDRKRWKYINRWFINYFGRKIGNRLYRIVSFPYRVRKKILLLGIKGTVNFVVRKYIGINVGGRK